MSAVTLAEMANITDKALKKGVIQGLRKESQVMDMLPFETIGDLSQKVVRYKTLPAGGFRKINAGFSSSKGTTEQLEESLALYGVEFDVDKQLVNNKSNITNPRALQTKMHTRALAYTFNDWFINGDKAVTPDGFDGLKVRIASLDSAQTIDGASLDISTSANVETNAQAFLDLLDRLKYACDGHTCDAFLMNDKVLLALWSMLRRKSLLDVTKDQFGREIMSYGGIKLVDMGCLTDQTTKVITDAHDGSAGITSVYAVKFGQDEYVHGLQKTGMEVDDLGILQTAPVYRTRIEWPVSITLWNPRSAARLKAIKIA